MYVERLCPPPKPELVYMVELKLAISEFTKTEDSSDQWRLQKALDLIWSIDDCTYCLFES